MKSQPVSNKKIRTGCFIMCRLGSTRLPNKALLKIKNKSTIEHVIDRAKMVKSADIVVLCTPADKSNDILEIIANSKGIEVFRGPVGDTLREFMGAADKFNVDFFAVYTADDIFCDPYLMDLGIEQITEGDFDFVNIPEDIVCGGSAYCISTKALRQICESRDTKNSSYFPPFFINERSLNLTSLRVDEAIYKSSMIRMTLDYPEDMEFFRKVFDEFGTDSNTVSLKEIIKLIKEKPEIAKINYFRQSDFINNQSKVKYVRT